MDYGEDCDDKNKSTFVDSLYLILLISKTKFDIKFNLLLILIYFDIL